MYCEIHKEFHDNDAIHCFYSEKANEFYRKFPNVSMPDQTVVLENGETVKCTGKYRCKESGEKYYMWDDKIYLGVMK